MRRKDLYFAILSKLSVYRLEKSFEIFLAEITLMKGLSRPVLITRLSRDV